MSHKISQYRSLMSEIRESDPDHILLKGYKVFSQVDEDGIIEAIFSDISEKNKVFVEIGCGNGLENNTHLLLLRGWKGVWIDGGEENIEFIKKNTHPSPGKLVISQKFIYPDNAIASVSESVAQLGVRPKEIDFLSLDIDGFDYEVLRHVIDLGPRVLCVEYNPEFRPPHEVSVDADGYTGWDRTMYHGASLQKIFNLLQPKGYALVCCSLSGYNAFFVKEDQLHNLTAKTPTEVYQTPREYLVGIRFGHKKGFGFLNQVLKA